MRVLNALHRAGHCSIIGDLLFSCSIVSDSCEHMDCNLPASSALGDSSEEGWAGEQLQGLSSVTTHVSPSKDGWAVSSKGKRGGSPGAR